MKEIAGFIVIFLFIGITGLILHGVIDSSKEAAAIRRACVMIEADHVNGSGKWRCTDGVIHILPD